MSKTKAFEENADLYDEWFGKHTDLYEAELKAVRLLIPSGKNKGMEVGVGSGRFSDPLGITVGVEPSPSMAEKARKRGIEVHSGVAEELPFPDGQFDYVLMVTTICFVDSVPKSFREVHRVLKEGGALVVGFVDKESDLGKAYAKKKEKSRFYGEATFFSSQEVIDHLENSGFEIEEVVQTLIPGEAKETVADGFGKGAFVVIKGTHLLHPGA